MLCFMFMFYEYFLIIIFPNCYYREKIQCSFKEKTLMIQYSLVVIFVVFLLDKLLYLSSYLHFLNYNYKTFSVLLHAYMFTNTTIKSLPFFISCFKTKRIPSLVFCRMGKKEREKNGVGEGGGIMFKHRVNLLLLSLLCSTSCSVLFIPQTFIEHIL